MQPHRSLLLPLLVLGLLLSNLCCATMSVTGLTCEWMENPVGINAARPRLSWVLESKQRAQSQSAWQILVASSKANLEQKRGDLWDSGKVASDESLQVPYSGEPLKSGQRCFWKVRVWDQDNMVSKWSAVGSFEMGLIDRSDWQAKWIGRTTDKNAQPAPLLRRTFTAKSKIKAARVYVCGLGYYELHANGRRIGQRLLDPGYTRYDKRVLYSTYDVTDAIRAGTNAIGVILGNGWYNVHTVAVWDFQKAPWRAAPKVLLQLRIDYADGTSDTIISDEQWKTSTGGVVFDSIYSGETYDTAAEKPGWDTAGYDDSGWDRALLVEAPQGVLKAQVMPPIRAAGIGDGKSPYMHPIKITESRPGIYVCDFGQNMAGFVEMSSASGSELCSRLTNGDARQEVKLRYGERLDKSGSVERSDIDKHVVKFDNQEFQTDTYIFHGNSRRASLRAGKREQWLEIPRFSYNGFQYVEISGLPARPATNDLRAVFIHSDIEPAGEFECSNPLLNKIWSAARWAYLSNLQSMPTDCPHREKNGWTGDAHLAAEQGLLNYAPQAVYEKWLNDIDDEQRPSGEIPGIVPTSGWGYKWGNGPAWDSAFLLIPFYLYEYTGDTRALVDHYAGMKRYVDYLSTRAKEGIVSIGLNDWAPFETKTPADITSTAYYYRDTEIIAVAARILSCSTDCEASERDAKGDYTADAEKYSALAASIKDAFNRRFYNATNGTYGTGSQTALSCALYQGLVAPENRALVVSNLVAAVEKRDGHIDTGILGAKYLLNALLENGRGDIAYRIASQHDLPSWGWWIEQGATTLWEQWNGAESRNHIMYGDISAWFYKALAGIQLPTEESFLSPQQETRFQLKLARRSSGEPAVRASKTETTPAGFKRFTIAPQIVGDLTSAKARYRSVRGEIVSDWHIQNGRFDLHVVIPANTEAEVRLPTSRLKTVTESDTALGECEGIAVQGVEGGKTVLRVGSGEYLFRCVVDGGSSGRG